MDGWNFKRLLGPITIDAEYGVFFDSGRRRQDFDLDTSAEAKRVPPVLNRYPGLYLIAMHADQVLRHCQNITFTGFGFRGFWPTCIAIQNGQGLSFSHMAFRKASI